MRGEQTPLVTAQLEHLRGRILMDELDGATAALECWQSSLEVDPGHVPSLLALREHALITDDRALAERLFDTYVAVDAPFEHLPLEAAEAAGFFLLVWLFRWPDDQRAVVALAQLQDAGDPDGLVGRTSHLVLDEDDLVGREHATLDTFTKDRQAVVLAELGRHLIGGAGGDDGWALLAQAADRDPVAAWWRVEKAVQAEEEEVLTRALLVLSGLCPGNGKPVLEFIAAERREFRLGQTDQAKSLYEDVRGGTLRAVVAFKDILYACSSFRADPLAYAATLAEQMVHLGDGRLEAVLCTRAAQLASDAGDLERARMYATKAIERWPEDLRARRLVERLAWRARDWHALSASLVEGTSPVVVARLRAAQLEHIRGDGAAALSALEEAEQETPSLLALRTRQRLSRYVTGTDAETAKIRQLEARIRAAQAELSLAAHPDRIVDLYARVGRFFILHTRHEARGLTYLLWAIEGHPAHIFALRLLEAVSRASGRNEMLEMSLHGLIDHFDRVEDRLPLRRELVRMASKEPKKRVDLYSGILADAPGDEASIVSLLEIFETQSDLSGLVGLRSEIPVSHTVLQARVDAAISALKGAEEPEPLAMPAQPEPPQRQGAPPVELAESTSPDWALEFGESDIEALLGGVAEASSLDPAELEVQTDVNPAPQDRPATEPDLPVSSADPLVSDSAIDFVLDEDLVSESADSNIDPMDDPESVSEPTKSSEITETDVEMEAIRPAPRRKPPPLVNPARAVIARKLHGSKERGHRDEWLDYGDAEAAAAIKTLETTTDVAHCAAATATLAERYEVLGRSDEAARAWRTVLGYDAGDRRAVNRLESVYRAREDWTRLADLLAREANRVEDTARRQSLLIEVARLEIEELDQPGSGVAHFREALDLGSVPSGIIVQFSQALRAVRRWGAYVEALAMAGLDDPAQLSGDDAFELGRVYLHSLGEPTKAIPYLVRAARVHPDRVGVVADLAEARAALGQVDQSIALLEEAIRVAIDVAPASRNVLRIRLARLYEQRRGDDRAALEVYRSALDDGLDDPAVFDHVEQLADRLGDDQLLARLLRLALKDGVRRNNPPTELRDLALRLGQLYRERLGQPVDAAEMFVEAYVLEPTDDTLYNMCFQLLNAHPQPGLEAKLYEARLSAPDTNLRQQLEISIRLARAYERGERFDESIALLEVLRVRLSEDRQVVSALERVYQSAERWSDLVALYEAQRERATDRVEERRILRRLARTYETGLLDLPKATDIYRRLSVQDKDDHNSLRALSRLLEAQKRWDELLEISERELAQAHTDRQRAYIHFRMGSLHESQLGNIPAAVMAYERALDADQRCFPALHGLRELAAREGAWPRVIGYLKRELDLWEEPKERAAILAHIGQVYSESQGDQERALLHFQEAVDAYPACVPAARALADNFYEDGRYEEAAPHFQVITRQGLDRLPRKTRADLFYRRGVVARTLGRRLEAVECLKLALEFDGEHAEALEALVSAWAGEPTEDPKELDARLAEAHSAADDAVQKARIDVLRGHTAAQRLDMDAAVRHFESALECCPDDPSILTPLVELWIKRRRWTEATNTIRRFIDGLADRIGDSEVRRRFVDAALWEGDIWSDYAVDPGRALDCYGRALAVEPDLHIARYRQAQCRFIMGDHDGALETIEALLSLDLEPEVRARYRVYRGRIRAIGFGNETLALEDYRAAQKIDPNSGEALLASVLSLRQGRKIDELMALLETQQALVESPLDENPALAMLKTVAGSVLHDHGQSDAAERLLKPLAEGSGFAARDARFVLAGIHAGRDRVDAATEVVLRSLDEDVCDVRAVRTLAGLATQSGDQDRLLQTLSVLELYGALDVDERTQLDLLEDRFRKLRDRGGHVISDEDTSFLYHPSFLSPVVPLLSLCNAALQGRTRARPYLERTDRVGGRRHTFTLELRLIQALMGYEAFDLYFTDRNREVSIWPGNRPLIVLGAKSSGEAASLSERRFQVGRAVFSCRAGLAWMHDLAAPEALDAVRRVGELYAPQEDARADAERLLTSLEGSGLARAYELLGDRADPLPARYTGESVLIGIERTADRAGLIASGHLRAAVTAIARTSGAVERVRPGADLTWIVRTRSRLHDLVKYGLSDAYRELRQRIGIAI